MASRFKRFTTVALAVSAALGSFALGSPRAAAATTIQPGDYMATRGAACTLGFVVEGGGKTYFMTAAHCVHDVGDAIRLADGTWFGNVAVIDDAGRSATDWALIRVRTTHVASVRATVRGVPQTPSGTATSSNTSVLDGLRFSGHGIPWFVSPTLREQRVGALSYHDANIYDTIGPHTWGDSGGPVVHTRTGRALGLVSRLCVGVCSSQGPTVEGILAKAQAKGFAVTLRTA